MSALNSNVSSFYLKTHPITQDSLLGASLEEILKRVVDCRDSQISYVPTRSHVLSEPNNGKAVSMETDRN